MQSLFSFLATALEGHASILLSRQLYNIPNPQLIYLLYIFLVLNPSANVRVVKIECRSVMWMDLIRNVRMIRSWFPFDKSFSRTRHRTSLFVR